MLTETKVADIPQNRGPKNVVTLECEMFQKSDWEACEIDQRQYKNLMSCYMTYYRAIKRARLAIKIQQRGDRIFLIKEGKV